MVTVKELKGNALREAAGTLTSHRSGLHGPEFFSADTVRTKIKYN